MKTIDIKIPVIINYKYMVPEDLLLSFKGESFFEQTWTRQISEEIRSKVYSAIEQEFPYHSVMITGHVVTSAFLERAAEITSRMDKEEG